MIRRAAALEAALLAAAFAALAWWSWGTWPDVLVDFGRELYVPWRLSAGDVLYRDVASFYGPLSPYVNALWFRLFGVGLRTLVMANLALLAATTALLRGLLVRAGTRRGAATAAALAFLCMCGFGRLVANGSFNFVAPYAHEATHGLLLALAALFCALRAGDAAPARLRWTVASGLLCGLAFLTKPEGFMAGIGASALALAVTAWPLPRREQGALGAAFAAALLAPPLLAFGLLALALPADEAWRGTLGSWAYVGNGDLLGQRYFAWSMGLDEPRAQALQLAEGVGRTLLLLAPAALLARALRGRPWARRAAPLAAGLLTVAALAPFWRARWWFAVARPLPLWALLVFCAAAGSLRRSRDAESARTAAARMALAAFALLLLPRIALNARLFHYGFALAAPALVLLVAALLDWIPRRLDAGGAPGAVFAAMAGGALAVSIAFHLSESQARMDVLSLEVGAGADRFRADARGGYVEAALQALGQVPPPARTLVVLPEGVMINYLLRRPSGVPYLTMLPSDELQFGEDELLGALQRHPPDQVALVHRSTSEFGLGFFGADYAQRTLGWVRAHYAPVFTVGDPPLQADSRFGIAVLRRAAENGPRP